MTKKLLFIFSFSFLIFSCQSSKGTISYKKYTKGNKTPTIADKIIWKALSYKGVRYKYGGTSKKGMDCSGLIYTAFKHKNIFIPRTSRQMYTKGYSISLRKVKRGDLLFFKTSRKRAKINHVGLVTSVKNGDILFIHSTSNKGVIITSLKQKY